MEPTSPDVLSLIGSGISSAVIQVVVSMLTPAIGWLTLPTLMLIQAIKVGMTHFYKAPSGDQIWFAIGPVSGALVALVIWKEPIPHWLAAGAAASLLANVIYAMFLKRFVGKVSPKTYNRMNILVERRKRDTMSKST